MLQWLYSSTSSSCVYIVIYILMLNMHMLARQETQGSCYRNMSRVLKYKSVVIFQCL